MGPLLLAGLLAGFGQRPAEAAISSVTGSACGYYTRVSLAGAAPSLRGCGQVGGLGTSTSPVVNLPAGGSAAAITATDANGAKAVYGTTTFFGGEWPADLFAPPPSGPLAVSTKGTPADGTVTSSADIGLLAAPLPVRCGYDDPGTTNCEAYGGLGPPPVEGDTLHVECSASEAAVSGRVSFVNGLLTTSTDDLGNPVGTELIPNDPPVNYTRSGTITNPERDPAAPGDLISFTVVLNQQIVSADGSLTVNGAHLYLFGPMAVGEVVEGQAKCGTSPHPAIPADTVAPGCAPSVVEPVDPIDPTKPLAELIGAFDAGGLQSISNIQATNATVQVGQPTSSFAYLKFVPGQTGPLQITATRTDAAEASNLPIYWSFDATDKAGNTTSCHGLNTPMAGQDSYSTSRNMPLVVPAPGVLVNDTAPSGGPMTAALAGAPAHGSVVLNSDGSFTYTPTNGFSGADTFTYTLSDGQGGVATGTVTITVVAPANRPPTAVNDTYGTNEDVLLTVGAPGVLANDGDPDGNTLAAGSAGAPAHGTVVLRADGSFTYTPNVNFNGSDSFTYVVSDGLGGTGTGTVSITVAPVNDAPVAGPDSYTTGEDTALTVAAPGLLANDTDVDGDTLTAGSASAPGHGSVAMSANGGFVYSPVANFNGSDSFTYLVSDGHGGTGTGTVTIAVVAPAGVAFHALTPVRILDSRPPPSQVGPYGTPWGPGDVRDVAVTGATVPAGADAVVLNVTVTGTTGAGYLTMWPAGQPQPLASSLNWAPGQTVPNAVTVKVGAGGRVSILNPVGSTNVIVDLVGYYDGAPGDGFTSLTPARILDSRPPPNQVGPYGTPWTPGLARDVTVSGGAVPNGADAVVLNVTATGTTGAGYLTIWPTGQPQPLASSLNWAPGQTIPNAVTVKVGAGGKVSVLNPVGNADVIVDVVGYFAAGSGQLFHPLSPARVQDSRPPPSQVGPYSTPWGAGVPRTVQVSGAGGVPAAASAALLNVTVTGTTGASYLTIWPAGQAAPLASSLNWAAGQTIPNSVTTKLSPAGAISVQNAAGSVDVIVDSAGWYG